MAENGNGNGTTKNVLKWVAGLVAAVIVAAFTIQYQAVTERAKVIDSVLSIHESRLTKTETCLEYMKSDLSEIKELTKEIRRDQVRRERQGR